MTDSLNFNNARRNSRLPSAELRAKRRRIRMFKNGLSRFGITAAGFGVVFSLALIFIYLFYEVMPVFKGASVTEQTSYQAPGVSPDTQVLHLVMERYEELGVVFTDDRQVTFFEAGTGLIRNHEALPLPADVEVTSFAKAEEINGLVSYGLSDGRVVLTKPEYRITYPDDERHIEPSLAFPFGAAPVEVDPEGQALRQLAVQQSARGGRTTMVVAQTDDNRLVMAELSTREDMFSGEVQTRANFSKLPELNQEIVQILVDKELRSVFIADTAGYVHYFDIRNFRQPELTFSANVGQGEPVTAMEFLVGAESLIMGTGDGQLSQWFLVRDEQNNRVLERIRDFRSHGSAITRIAPEYTRKGFVAGDSAGQIGIHYGTSARTLLLQPTVDTEVTTLAISPVNRRLFTLDANNQLHVAEVWNRHPQISWSALWNRVWYEGRSDPEYIWQSSSASDEFESKFSLVPLSIGTLKAAFFAMLFAMPLAIMGAVYTAYFMTPKLRGAVKPTIEIMEALPTVILGFLAGLWLAPFMENNLPAVFSLLLGLPLVMLLTAVGWKFLPKAIRNRVPPGWEAAILLPVVLLFGWWMVNLSPWIEIAFFDGSMRQWFTEMGITYDQRNAMVVGVAMGFAIIPTIYSIAEDAVFNVPRHLTQGSLALGATPWQTVLGVVIPTASPGIFSAVMIGFGRAVGETMIVLMATGNSPIVNFNIFEGMRTLSANIAVELPETAVGSSHFRILFLAALVLLTFTFILNTIAEIVRQRLRRRYSSL
ncbi:phosphate ABC transporter permease [Aliidiomarina minuta]|uniref:Phosphate ABC transporter permease n=1 Tax=Aliidiomarina minuta TaxID=880057 RepID=A0A432W4G7_9GAMM|nr:ABC transporter permease subunit [Aliidiomarina minuta]RUO24385.1 phosphate ABC transporter permease [Aliidiomarina minuta]